MGMNIYLKDSENYVSGNSDDNIVGSPTSTKKGLTLMDRAFAEASSVHLALRAFARNADLMSPHSGGLCSNAVPKAPAMPPRSPAKYSTHLSAKAELTLLSDLLGVTSAKRGDKRSDDRLFKINLFPNESFAQDKDGSGGRDSKGSSAYDSSGGGGGITIDIDAAAGAKSLSSYMEDLDWDEDEETGPEYAADAKQGYGEDDDDDLLALMDSAK
jgi:hypothetical protein